MKKPVYKRTQILSGMAEIKSNENYSFIMRNMAIVPYSGLDINVFYNWSYKIIQKNREHRKIFNSDINYLIDNQWIQTKQKGKSIFISLHPNISKIAYKVLQPNSKKCFELIDNMTFYAATKQNKTHIEWKKTVEILELACNRIRDSTPLTADLYQSIAAHFYYLADYNMAVKYQKHSLHILKILGDDGSGTICSLVNLADICCCKEEFTKSLKLYYKAESLIKKFRIMEFDLATLYNKMGFIHVKLNNFPKAFELFTMALEIFNKSGYLIDGFNSHIGLGEVCFALNDSSKALECYRKALEIRKKIPRAKIINTKIYNNIGLAYFYLRKNEKALKYINKAITITEKYKGSRHPDSIKIRRLIANIRKDQNAFRTMKKLIKYL